MAGGGDSGGYWILVEGEDESSSCEKSCSGHGVVVFESISEYDIKDAMV